jgi:anti-anti-sigma factor
MSDIAHVHFEGDATACIVCVAGEIDVSNARTIYGKIAAQIGDAPRIVLDLSGTTFLDSSGIALLLELEDRLTLTRHEFYVVIPDDAPIRRVVSLSGLDTRLTILTQRANLPTPQP